MIWQLIFITILAFVSIVLSIQFFYIILGGYSPFFLTKRKVIKRIINEISFNDGDVVYELGCGNAGFLKRAEKKFPKIKKLVGIELFFFPYLIGSIQISLQKSKIKILKKNFYHINFKEADIIYCFLLPGVMKKLKDKFVNDCKKGTQIISYQFSLPDMEPVKVIDLENNKKDKIYFYEI